jgi:hypothetical protein
MRRGRGRTRKPSMSMCMGGQQGLPRGMFFNCRTVFQAHRNFVLPAGLHGLSPTGLPVSTVSLAVPGWPDDGPFNPSVLQGDVRRFPFRTRRTYSRSFMIRFVRPHHSRHSPHPPTRRRPADRLSHRMRCRQYGGGWARVDKLVDGGALIPSPPEGGEGNARIGCYEEMAPRGEPEGAEFIDGKGVVRRAASNYARLPPPHKPGCPG